MSIEGNKLVVRRYFEEFHSRRVLSLADEILAPEIREFTLGLAHMMTIAFPDYQLAIVDQVAEGDRVATVWSGQGTHQGEWKSPIGAVPPSGNVVRWTATTTLRLRDGKIAEVVGTNWDHLGMLQQMGALPNTAPRSGA